MSFIIWCLKYSGIILGIIYDLITVIFYSFFVFSNGYFMGIHFFIIRGSFPNIDVIKLNFHKDDL